MYALDLAISQRYPLQVDEAGVERILVNREERNVASWPKIRPQKSCGPGKKRERPDNVGAYHNFLRYIFQEKANRYAKFPLPLRRQWCNGSL